MPCSVTEELLPAQINLFIGNCANVISITVSRELSGSRQAELNAITTNDMFGEKYQRR